MHSYREFQIPSLYFRFTVMMDVSVFLIMDVPVVFMFVAITDVATGVFVLACV